jgi:acyl carrier protein
VSTAAEIEQFIVGDVAAGRGLDSVAHDSDLLADGVIDSLGITELITFLERRYGIKVADDDIDAENFRSVQAIVAFVERKGA